MNFYQILFLILIKKDCLIEFLLINSKEPSSNYQAFRYIKKIQTLIQLKLLNTSKDLVLLSLKSVKNVLQIKE
jgi:hypothetical protein